MKLRSLLTLSAVLLCINVLSQPVERNIRTQEYKELQDSLCKGWNIWYNNSLTSYVYLPDGFAISLCLATNDNRALLRDVFKASEIQRRPEKVIPGLRSDDGSYTSLALEYRDIRLKIETASEGRDFYVLITPEKEYQHSLVVEAGIAYGNDGMVGRQGNRLVGRFDDYQWNVNIIGNVINKEYITSVAPRVDVLLNGEVAISTCDKCSLQGVRDIIGKSRDRQQERVDSYGDLSDSFLSMQTVLAWNTIYDPANKRAITPVSRNWNQNWGGFVLFDWDTYFASYMLSLFNKNLAYANAIEVTKGITPDGFIPNYQSVSGPVGGNGLTSAWYRSQPPVGSMIVWEIYNRYHEKWFLEEVYDELLTWNRWWMTNRYNQGYLAWGGSYWLKDGKEYNEGLQGAKFESGLDNSPMYDGVPMDSVTHTMMLADVGLMSMYVMDCRKLADIASELGRRDDVRELRKRAEIFSKKLATLWDEKTGMYLNKHLDTSEFSPVLSPTNFYPLLAGICSEKQAKRMINEHYFNPEEFYGEYVIPSIARNAKGFSDNNYWRGRIWGPMNFLVYMGMRNYDVPDARKDLIEKSKDLLLSNWRKNGGIFENYNSETGQGDDVRNADGFYHWGALLTFIEFIEKGL